MPASTSSSPGQRALAVQPLDLREDGRSGIELVPADADIVRQDAGHRGPQHALGLPPGPALLLGDGHRELRDPAVQQRRRELAAEEARPGARSLPTRRYRADASPRGTRRRRPASESGGSIGAGATRSTSDTPAANARLKPAGVRSGAGRSRLTARFERFRRQRPHARSSPGRRRRETHQGCGRRAHNCRTPATIAAAPESSRPSADRRRQTTRRRRRPTARRGSRPPPSMRPARRRSRRGRPGRCPRAAGALEMILGARGLKRRRTRTARAKWVAVAPSARLFVGVRIVRERDGCRRAPRRGYRPDWPATPSPTTDEESTTAAEQHGGAIEAAEPRGHRALEQLAQVLRVLSVVRVAKLAARIDVPVPEPPRCRPMTPTSMSRRERPARDGHREKIVSERMGDDTGQAFGEKSQVGRGIDARSRAAAAAVRSRTPRRHRSPRTRSPGRRADRARASIDVRVRPRARARNRRAAAGACRSPTGDARPARSPRPARNRRRAGRDRSRGPADCRSGRRTPAPRGTGDRTAAARRRAATDRSAATGTPASRRPRRAPRAGRGHGAPRSRSCAQPS